METFPDDFIPVGDTCTQPLSQALLPPNQNRDWYMYHMHNITFCMLNFMFADSDLYTYLNQ